MDGKCVTMRKLFLRAICAVMCLTVLAGCSGANHVATEGEEAVAFIDAVAVEEANIEDEIVALSEAPSAPTVTQETAVAAPSADSTASATEDAKPAGEAESAAPAPVVLVAEATGEKTKKSSQSVIDYSNADDGYVMVNFTGETSKRLKVQVVGPKTTYTYNLTPQVWTVFPLSDGNGAYQVKIFQNVTGNKYSLESAASLSATLKDEFAPFIRPNQYVNYTADSKAVAKAAELTKGMTDPLQKVGAVYNYVIKNTTYDRAKAASVTSGYLPNLDQVLESKQGICFDYAALMTGMLRSQGVPCKLVIGYAGTAYHAWISVWSEGIGWVENAVYFDGTTWQRMDPTFASTGGQSEQIMAYIGNGQNYSAKYLY